MDCTQDLILQSARLYIPQVYLSPSSRNHVQAMQHILCCHGIEFEEIACTKDHLEKEPIHMDENVPILPQLHMQNGEGQWVYVGTHTHLQTWEEEGKLRERLEQAKSQRGSRKKKRMTAEPTALLDSATEKLRTELAESFRQQKRLEAEIRQLKAQQAQVEATVTTLVEQKTAALKREHEISVLEWTERVDLLEEALEKQQKESAERQELALHWQHMAETHQEHRNLYEERVRQADERESMLKTQLQAIQTRLDGITQQSHHMVFSMYKNRREGDDLYMEWMQQSLGNRL